MNRKRTIEALKNLEIFPQSYLQKLALGSMTKEERENQTRTAALRR